MELKQRIEKDLKEALLSGDKSRAETLRGLKSVILYEEVAKGERETGLNDEGIISLLVKEAKKRQESADLYRQGGSEERAKKELDEKALIETYLPRAMSDEEISALIDKTLAGIDDPGLQNMGQIIGSVKQAAGGAADGATIARLVKGRLVK
jgi:uncharacterized protein YqeY